jgi:hypothetical protein
MMIDESAMYEKPGAHETTLKGLNVWHKHMFEELGWMVLVQAKGAYDYKIVAYKKSIDHLLKSLEESMHVYTEADRKHDVMVLHKNVCVLRDFVKKHL